MTTPTYVPLLAEDLRALGACPWQVQAVARLWPNDVVPTPENLARARRANLSLGWLAKTLDPTGYGPLRAALDAEYWPRYSALDAEYWSRRDALYAEFAQHRAALRAEFWERQDALTAEYWERQDALAYDVLRACWPVWDEE